MKKITRIATIILAIAIMLTAFNPMPTQAATKKVALNKTKATLTMTDKKKSPSVTLKVKNAKKNAKWTTSNKKVATVKKTGNYTAKVTVKKAGTAKITATVNGKKYTCKIVVQDKTTKKSTGSKNNGTTNCQHTWKEHKAKMCYNLCSCGKWFWGTTGAEANDAWALHSYEAALNGTSAEHAGFSGDIEKYTDYKYCTKCGKKVTYEMPAKYKCNHNWKDWKDPYNKSIMYYYECKKCGKCFYGKTPQAAYEKLTVHEDEANAGLEWNSPESEWHTNKGPCKSEEYTKFKYCTKCYKMVEYEMPEKYK